MANILFDIAKKIPMSEKHTLYNIAIMCEAYAIYVDARYTKIAGMIWEDAPLEWRILSNKRLNISGASSVDSINYDMAKWLIQRDIQVNNEIMKFDWRIAHIVLEYRSLFNKHTIYNHISAPIVSSIQMLIYKENHEMQHEVGSQLMLMFIQRHILEIMDSGTDKGFKLGFMPQTVYSTAASLVIYLAGSDDITHEQIHRTIKESYKLSLYEKYIQDLNLYSDGYYNTIFTIRELSFIRSGLRLEAFEILKACAVTEQISSEKEVLDIVKREAMHYLYHDVVLLLPKLSYIPNKIIMEFLVGKLQEETFTHIIGVIPSDFSIAGYIKYNNGRGLSFYQDLHKIFGDKTFDLLTERYLNEQERENIYSLATTQLSKIMKINKIVEYLMQAPYKTSFSKIVLALDPKAQAQSDYNMKYQLLMSIKFHFIIRAINEAENIARMYNIDIDATEMLYDTLLQREQNDGEHIAILQPQQNFSQDRGFNDSGERINPMQINVNEELYDQNMFFSAMDYFSNL